MIVQKVFGEELFTFVIKWYSSLELIGTFFEENGITDTDYFKNQPAGTDFIVSPPEKPLPSTGFVDITFSEFTPTTQTKKINQNLFDFVLTWYGNLSYLDEFLEANSISNISLFASTPIGTAFNITSPPNKVVKTYLNGNYEVATGSVLPIGDYNDDYNDDYYN